MGSAAPQRIVDPSIFIQAEECQYLASAVNGKESSEAKKQTPYTDPSSAFFGDHIYVARLNGAYTHHAIRTGDDSVVHYGGPFLDRHLISQGVARIYLSTLADFACDNNLIQVRKYESCDPPHFVVHRAIQMIGLGDYNAAFANCEHFATYCKTGEWKSDQVDQVLSSTVRQWHQQLHYKVTDSMFAQRINNLSSVAGGSDLVIDDSFSGGPYLHAAPSKATRAKNWFYEQSSAMLCHISNAFDERTQQYVEILVQKSTDNNPQMSNSVLKLSHKPIEDLSRI